MVLRLHPGKCTHEDNHHALIVWADTQMVKDKDAESLITVSAPDTAALVTSLGNIPVHGITVGDLGVLHPGLLQVLAK